MNKENKNELNDTSDTGCIMLEETAPEAERKLHEDVSKREKCVKHYRLPNGNNMAVVYDYPVHRFDYTTGKYLDINPEITETDAYYETVAEEFSVRMPKKEGKDRFVTVKKEGYEVSWKYVPHSTSRRRNSVAAFCCESSDAPWKERGYPSVGYENADTGTNLKYDISRHGVKESIILSKKPRENKLTFRMKFKGILPVLSDDRKNVFLVSDDEESGSEEPVMIIPPAFMEDAGGASCDKIVYELRNADDGIFLDLIPDADWLSNPERVYPVVIDPRVEVSSGDTNGMKMIEVCSDGSVVPVTGTGIGRRIGVNTGGTVHRVYIGLNLPALVDGFKITKAGLILHQKQYWSGSGNIEDYSVAPVTDPNGKMLSVNSFRWSNVGSLSVGTPIDTIHGYYRRPEAEIDIDMTAVVQGWYDSGETFSAEKCLVIKKKDECCCCCSSCQTGYLDLYSLSADSRYRPRMYIEYSSSDMYSDHQKYHTFEAGRAGTGSVNLFTGKMSFAHGDITSEGVKLPLAVSHLYRHEYVNEEAGSVNRYGKGWKLSTEQTLEIVNKHGIAAVYTNAQGKRHYFMANEVSPNGEITDDAGLGLIFREECNCICGSRTTHTLTDEKGNKMTFNSSGRLVQLIDTNGNISCLTYRNGVLTGVSDGSGHTAQLMYDSSGKLSKIADNGDISRAITYEYNASGELNAITYPSADSAYPNEGVLQTHFVYGSNSRLEQVVDHSGIAYAVGYDGNGRVKKLTVSGSCIIADNSVTDSETLYDDPILFEYRSGSTAVKNGRTGAATVYRFDGSGREMSSYRDMTGAADSSLIGESTASVISGYEPVVDAHKNSRTGKYRSLNVTLNGGDEEINLIKNGFFAASGISAAPDGWLVVGSGKSSAKSYIPGKTSFGFASGGFGKYLLQTVDLCCCRPDGNTLVASAWAKAVGAASSVSEKSDIKFRICLSVTYEDGGTEEHYENYDPGYSGWQYAAVPFVLNKNRSPIRASVRLDYTANSGTCSFTNARLVTANGIVTTNTYRTDDDPLQSIHVFGESRDVKMISTKDDGILTTIDYIDTESDIVRTDMIGRDRRRFITEYKYDSHHNVIRTEDYRGLVIEYTYNGYGRELTRKTYHKDNPDAYLFSEHTYQDGGFVSSESDPRYILNGEKLKTEYQRDTSRDLLLKQTDVGGQEYNYSYDDRSDDLVSLSSVADSKKNENSFFYTRGYLTRVEHNGFNFGFSFDQLGRSRSVTVGDSTVSTVLSETSYSADGVNDITETVYASGEKNQIVTDISGNPVLSTYIDRNGASRTVSSAEYDHSGKIKKLVDNEQGVCYNYTYDTKGNLVGIIETDKVSGAVLSENSFVSDACERLTEKTFGAVGQTYRPIYEDDGYGYVYPDNEAIGISLDGKFTDKVTKDGLRRAQRRTFTVGANVLFDENFGYISTPYAGKSIATEMVAEVTGHVFGINADSVTMRYTYDKAGNPETVSRGENLLAKYSYDGLNRLRREDNHAAGKTFIWDYDAGGNIICKKEYPLCTDVNLGPCTDSRVYTYKSEGWRDRLHSVNGKTCTYDRLGNPISYFGHTLEWTKVRRLAGFDGNTFSYGASGIRYRKNNTVYTLDGSRILRESDGTKTLTYYHGGSGIVGFAYNGTDYYFRKNLQGDVTSIYTAAGEKVADYTYDAWGKILSADSYTSAKIGDLNPIRYRGYYYDVETGLYYLNSRYYDPETGRFINADTTDVLENARYDINGLNLYAYCENNPVSGRDDEGNMSFWKKLAIAAAVVVAIAVVAAVVAAATAATGGAAGAALCAATSTFVGAAKGAAIGAVTGAITGAATGAVQGAVEGYNDTGTLEGTLRGMGHGAVKGAVEGAKDGLISGMVSGAFAGAMNPSFCFVAGTTVLTTLGKKAIETIRVGDTIPCVDHITGETAEKKVVSTTVRKVNRLTELDIDGEVIKCTETHPFQVKGQGWVEASELKPGDVVYTKGWGTATVRSVGLIELDEPVEVFNFEVEDCHTYFVGDAFVLVHNSGCTEAARNGIKKHKEWDYGQNDKTIFKEVKLGKAGRADAVDFENRIIYELKPNNPRAIRKGWAQLNRYAAELEQYFPGSEWMKIVITY